ncbi:MAG: hypothetical protein MUQ30_03415 [Anaerolineae bacterium]|nr:hypothetical protein [Anaerolineae bacterium]
MRGSRTDFQHAGLAFRAWQSIFGKPMDIEIGLRIRSAFRVSAAHGDALGRPREVTNRDQHLVNNWLAFDRDRGDLRRDVPERELPRA